jgi:hypothetical protein
MGAGNDATAVERHPRRSARVLIAAGAVALAVAIPATAFAGKGGGGSTSTTSWIALASVDGAKAATVQPRLGASVKFAAGYPKATSNPWVSLTCYQGGTLVYGQGGAPSEDFMLGGYSSVWLNVGGSADCTAELGNLYWKGGHEYYTYLATTSFTAVG